MFAAETAALLWDKEKPTEAHYKGTVRGINGNKLVVALNDSSVYAECSTTCTASIDDRVLVLVLTTGEPIVIGVLNGI